MVKIFIFISVFIFSTSIIIILQTTVFVVRKMIPLLIYLFEGHLLLHDFSNIIISVGVIHSSQDIHIYSIAGSFIETVGKK